MVNVYSSGGCEEVTGSNHIITIDDEKYMIDCGLFQGQNAYQKNKERKLDKDINGVILTHVHADHSCLVPKLIKEGYNGNIYSTPPTRDLATIMFLDSAKIQSFNKEVLYSEKDVVNTIKHFRCSVYGKEKKLSDKFKYTFYNAGHILGSALVDVSVPKYTSFFGKLFHSKKSNRLHILFSGDIGRKKDPIINPTEVNIPAPDYMFLESTYGNKLHDPVSSISKELIYIINRTIERGGKIIIPSFAIERTQELIYFIKKLTRDEKIPKVPVYIDSPMAGSATAVFNIHSECFNENVINEFLSKGKNPFSVKTLTVVNSFKDSLELAKSNNPCIIIGCNGMCEAGRIINHLKYGIGNPNNTILFVGYQGENTLGRKILNKEETIKIDNQEIVIKAEIHSINALSSHGDYKEIISWLEKIDTSKLKTIFLTHGDSEALISFKEKLNKVFPKIKVVIAKKNEVYKLK